MTKLTPPEGRTERDNGWKAVDRVKACGGCACCLNRDRETEGWGAAVCGLVPSLAFPACCGKTPGFRPDYERIYSSERVE